MRAARLAPALTHGAEAVRKPPHLAEAVRAYAGGGFPFAAAGRAPVPAEGRQPSRLFAMISRWISLVPPKIGGASARRTCASTPYSRAYP